MDVGAVDTAVVDRVGSLLRVPAPEAEQAGDHGRGDEGGSHPELAEDPQALVLLARLAAAAEADGDDRDRGEK